MKYYEIKRRIFVCLNILEQSIDLELIIFAIKLHSKVFKDKTLCINYRKEGKKEKEKKMWTTYLLNFKI